MHDLLLAFYADDFTGSTDALESLAKSGARTVLFTRPPSTEILSRYRGLHAVGVAGMTRCLPPDAMEEELGHALNALLELRPRHIHYKVCSTFDSSPKAGSVGCAIDIGRRVIGSAYVPLLVGAPTLGRYCAFGNLFAATGVGTNGQVFRLDRHPTASRHPSTPMAESDLRAHLGVQTGAKIALFDLLKLELPAREQRRELKQLVATKAEVVLFDILYEHQLERIGALLDCDASSMQTQFSVGSSGIEMALGAHWTAAGRLTPTDHWAAAEPATQILVVSGSCSPITHSQIEWATTHGFVEVALDTPALAAAESSPPSIQEPTNQVIALIKSGKSVVVHTSKGNTDPRISATAELLAPSSTNRLARNTLSARLLGNALGHLVRSALEETSIRRVCIAGGDTASFIAPVLGIEALEMLSPLTPGAPLCLVHAPGSPADGLEFNFKGGQVGGENYFGSILKGTI